MPRKRPKPRPSTSSGGSGRSLTRATTLSETDPKKLNTAVPKVLLLLPLLLLLLLFPRSDLIRSLSNRHQGGVDGGDGGKGGLGEGLGGDGRRLGLDRRHQGGLMAETAERAEVATAQAVANTMEEEAMTSTAAREAIPLSVGRAMLLTPVAWPSLPAMRAASAASPLARFPV